MHTTVLGLFLGFIVVYAICSQSDDVMPAVHLYATCSGVILEVAWRLSPLHPLAGFPGPLSLKVTGMALAQVVYTGRRHEYIRRLHQKYGGFVRTGSNSLSVSSVSAVSTIYASSCAMPKSSAYRDIRGGLKGHGLFSMQNKDEFSARKRLWLGALSSQAMDKYQDILNRRTEQLLQCIFYKSKDETWLDLSKFLTYWAFDITCDMTSSCPRTFNMLEEGDTMGFTRRSHASFTSFETLCEVPWLFDFMSLIPGLRYLNPLLPLENFSRETIMARMNHSCGDHDDLAAYLLGEKGTTDTILTLEDLTVDVLLSLQAGKWSDTVSGTLTLLIFYILRDKAVHYRLREELDALAASGSDPDMFDKTLSALPYLSAVVEEGIRLGSPFHGLPREVPKDGAVVDGVFVPGGTNISVTSYVLHTSDQNYWPTPEAFKPERWLPDGLGPETRTDKSAMLAFSAGPFGCLGKNWARRWLRFGVARLFLDLNLQFAPEFDQDQFLRGVTHTRAVMFKYPLEVSVTSRVARQN